MRRFLTGFVVAAIAAVIPAMALAGNQEVAEQIANRLRKSGQMSDYKIGVKYQDGTAWLQGHVASEEQMKTALRLVFQISSVDRVVNEMKVASSEAAKPAESETAQVDGNEDNPADRQAAPSGDNPLREQDARARQLKNAAIAEKLGWPCCRNRSRRPGSSPADASPEEDPAYADQVPSSYTPSAVEQVAAEGSRKSFQGHWRRPNALHRLAEWP